MMGLVLLCTYFTWLGLQNFLLPWIYRQQLLPASAVGVLMAGKEVILGAGIVLLLPRTFRWDWRANAADRFAVAYLLGLAVYLFWGPAFLHSTAPLALRAISARSLASPALFYVWGRLCFLSLRELRRFLWFLIGLQTAIALFGILEWLFLPATFWSDTVGVGAFLLDVKGMMENQNVVAGLPSNMFQFGIRRLLSTYGDPLAMGIASVFPLLLCVAWLLRRRGPWRWSIHLPCGMAAAAIGTALVLTIGRESIAAAGLGIAVLVWRSGKQQRFVVSLSLLLLCLAMLPVLWSYVAPTLTFREASAATHLRFLQTGWERIPTMLAGKGLGEAGGWAFSLAGVESEVGENSYFELMSQTGIITVALLVGFLITVAVRSWRAAGAVGDPWISAAFLAAGAHVIARSLSGIFSPSLFGVVPLASFFFFCGAGSTTAQRAARRPYLLVRRVRLLWQEGTAVLPSASQR